MVPACFWESLWTVPPGCVMPEDQVCPRCAEGPGMRLPERVRPRPAAGRFVVHEGEGQERGSLSEEDGPGQLDRDRAERGDGPRLLPGA